MTEDLSLYLRGDPLTSGQVMACPAPTRLRGSQIEQIAYGNGAQGRDAQSDTLAIEIKELLLARVNFVYHLCSQISRKRTGKVGNRPIRTKSSEGSIGDDVRCLKTASLHKPHDAIHSILQ